MRDAAGFPWKTSHDLKPKEWPVRRGVRTATSAEHWSVWGAAGSLPAASPPAASPQADPFIQLHTPSLPLEFQSGLREVTATSAKAHLKKTLHFWTLQMRNALLNLGAYSLETDLWLLPCPLPRMRRWYWLNTPSIRLETTIKQSAHKKGSKVSNMNNHFEDPCLLTVTT